MLSTRDDDLPTTVREHDRYRTSNSSNSRISDGGTTAAPTLLDTNQGAPMNDFDTINAAELDGTTGGNKGRAIWNGLKTGGAWAWRNVIGPAGGAALYDWATGGGNKQQPQQQGK